MKVRLTKKHAEQIDGVNLAGRRVGDVLDLTQMDARLLVAEEWAMPERRERREAEAPRRRSDDQTQGPRHSG
jgi:hypothetical protein